MKSLPRFLLCSGLSTLSLIACGEAGPSPSASGGATATGGTSSGGGPSSGGSLSTGGAATGGSTSGGAATGGTSSGGAATGGESASGGSDSSGGASSGGASGGSDSSGGQGSGGDGSGGGGSGKFALHSPDWDVIDNDECTKDTTEPCATYPAESTNLPASGPKNVSPEMSWTDVPEGTQSFVVLLQDLTNGLAHWVLWDIPADVTMLDRDLPKTATLTDPAGAEQAAISGSGYFGSGACGNVYEHRVYALKIPKLNPAMKTATGARTAVMALGDDILGESFARMQSRDCN